MLFRYLPKNLYLTYISTKGLTVIGWQCPTFTYYSGTAYPGVIQGSRTIPTTPDGYNSTLNAVKAYSDPYAVRRAYAEEVKITGIESQIVSDIYPICPQFSTHIR